MGRSALKSKSYLEANVICLQKTKIEGMSYYIVHSLWGCSHVDWCCLDSKGHPVVFWSCGIGGWDNGDLTYIIC